VATKIKSPDPVVAALWYVWDALMIPEGTDSPTWSIGLEEFMDAEELEKLFEKHFG